MHQIYYGKNGTVQIELFGANCDSVRKNARQGFFADRHGLGPNTLVHQSCDCSHPIRIMDLHASGCQAMPKRDIGCPKRCWNWMP